MNGGDWAVVAVVREAPEVIRRFVSWHLALGASRITLFFDDPTDPCIKMVDHLPQVRAIPCNPLFWQNIGIDPDRPFIKRQIRALVFAHQNAEHSWTANLDADELLCTFGDAEVAGMLAAQPAAIRTVLIRPGERVLIGTDKAIGLRCAMHHRHLRFVFDRELVPAMEQRGGLVGHVFGKSFVRRGLTGVAIRQHYPQDPAGGRVIDVTLDQRDGFVLAHLLGGDYDLWRAKLPFRLSNRSIPTGLRKILASYLDKGEESRIRAVYDQLFTMKPEVAAYLEERQQMVRPERDFDHAVATYFPKAVNKPKKALVPRIKKS